MAKTRTSKKNVKESAPRRRSESNGGRGKTLGLKVGETWVHLFQQNEKAKRSKKMTDDELATFMKKEFPDRTSKNVTAVQSNRTCYNKGVYNDGVAPKVQSHPYDDDGDKILVRRGRRSNGEETTSKKKATVKNKKTSKKKVKVRRL